MNTTAYMDKQIMDLSLSPTQHQQQSKDLMDLMNHEELEQQQQQIGNDDYNVNIKKEEMVPSYDFQPIRPLSSDQSARPWTSSSSDSIPISSKPAATTPIRVKTLSLPLYLFIGFGVFIYLFIFCACCGWLANLGFLFVSNLIIAFVIC